MKTDGVSEVFESEYRITRNAEGLVVEVLDYHAHPLFLDWDDLARFGLHVASVDPRLERDDLRNAERSTPRPRTQPSDRERDRL